MDHLALLEAEVAAMVDVLARADLDARLEHCPGWTTGDLVVHLIGVHDWALAALADQGPPPEPDESTIDGDLLQRYADSAHALVAELGRLSPDAPAWTFDRHDRTAGFWRRRQLHEVSVHRWDVSPYVLDTAVAADGIDEVLDFFLPRQLALGRTVAPEGTLRLVSPERAWAFGNGRPVVSVQGTASDLLLGLWGRLPQDHGAWTALTP